MTLRIRKLRSVWVLTWFCIRRTVILRRSWTGLKRPPLRPMKIQNLQGSVWRRKRVLKRAGKELPSTLWTRWKNTACVVASSPMTWRCKIPGSSPVKFFPPCWFWKFVRICLPWLNSGSWTKSAVSQRAGCSACRFSAGAGISLVRSQQTCTAHPGPDLLHQGGCRPHPAGRPGGCSA